MRRILIIVAILALVGVAAVPTASFLQVTGPVESSIIIKALGNDDCTFDIIDNEDDTPAGRLGRISTLAEDGLGDFIFAFAGCFSILGVENLLYA